MMASFGALMKLVFLLSISVMLSQETAVMLMTKMKLFAAVNVFQVPNTWRRLLFAFLLLFLLCFVSIGLDGPIMLYSYRFNSRYHEERFLEYCFG